jgi:glucose/arabinose dehydrogenase
VLVLRALAGHLALCALFACGARPAAREQRAPAAVHPAPARADGQPVPPAAEPLDEASARRLLAARFRAAGLRMVADVALAVDGVMLVADGFDPARKVGYEYVARDDVALDAGARARLARSAALRILVVDAAPAAAVERAAADFLAELPRQR